MTGGTDSIYSGAIDLVGDRRRHVQHGTMYPG